MNPADDRRAAGRAPLTELDAGLTAYQRRTVSVNDHLAFRVRMADEMEAARQREIDQMLDEEIEIDPFGGDPPSRRSDKELARMLDLIDNLPIA